MPVYPLLMPLVSALLGIFAAGTLSWFVPDDVVPYLLPLMLTAFLLRRRRAILIACLCVPVFCWGNLALKPLLRPAAGFTGPDAATGIPCTVEGVVAARSEGREEGERILVTPERLHGNGNLPPLQGKILLTVRNGRSRLGTGDRILFASVLKAPRNYGLPGEFDRVRHLAFRGVTALAAVATPANLVLLRQDSSGSLQGQIDKLSFFLGDFISVAVPGETGAILRALLLGDRSGISRRTEEAFSRAGVNHILSISGFHVAIVGLCICQVILLLVRRSESLALRFDLRRLVPLAALPWIIFYLFLSGAAPATTRSVLMIFLAAAVLLMERETDAMNILLAAAFGMLAVSPVLAYDISFQLSFLAVWGLVALTPLFQPETKLTGIARGALVMTAASAAATAATAIPVGFHFHRVALSGIAANLLVVPLLGYGAVITGFAALFLVPVFPSAAALLCQAAGMFISVSVRIVGYFAALPTISGWYPTALDVVLFLAGVLAVTLLQKKSQKTAALASLVLVMAAAAMAGRTDSPEKDLLRVSFFSVGQAEATLARLPGGETLLIDGAGSFPDSGFDAGERLVGPALGAMGITRLDRVILSHPHPDHLAGLAFVFRNFGIGELLMSRLAAASPAVVPLLDIARAKGVPVRLVDASTPPEERCGVTTRFLSPPGLGLPGVENDDNEDSLVVRISYGDISFLFTGDIGPFTEYRLTRDQIPLASTVLKVPHHGSRFSSTERFLRSVKPRIAVISAGSGNRFGLPSPDAVERISTTGARMFRTDRHGTVEISSNGREIVVATPYSGHLSLIN